MSLLSKGMNRLKSKQEVETIKIDTRPPFDLLDRTFRLPDETVLTVVGYQYGSPFVRVPFWARCQIVSTAEIVLADPTHLRRAEDITPRSPRRIASRKPHVARKTETLRLVAWTHPREFQREASASTGGKDQGEGGPIR